MEHFINCLIGCSLILCGVCSCGNQNRTELLPLKNISIQASDITKDEISDILELDSYVRLSNEVPLGQSERVIIDNEQIFILDDEPKIVCYNMLGDIVYKIDQHGPGPKEYLNIKDFGIDRESEKLVVFDDYKRKLFFYSSQTGKYISEFSTQYMAPTEMGIIGSCFFFKNMDHSRFKEQQEQMYYLLYTRTGEQIDHMFLPHDAVADFNFNIESFFYNNDQLLYITPFDKTVYRLIPGDTTPLYEIHLPNPLPAKKIEEKIDHWTLVNSEYTFGICDIYEAGHVLYFTFSKDGFVVSSFYDLSTDKLLYCGMRVLGDAREKFPFFSLIKGTYQDKFFSLVSPSSIKQQCALHPAFFPDELQYVGDEDNEVIAFYKININ